MEAADYIVDIGPGAGVHGGEIVVFAGTPAEIKKDENRSITGALSLRQEKDRRSRQRGAAATAAFSTVVGALRKQP